ncbi:MAG TPA: VWA domain-containing protein [Salinimicrobium sp.]|nr:VWA domain-containing protein [Salinimicrobium sp.]
MYILEEQKYFWLLLGILPLLMVFLFLILWRKKTQKKFADSHLLNLLSPNRSFFKPVLKFIFICLAILCLIIALVNPKMGTKIETIKREGVDIVFAIDVSKSMLAEDIAPNRLEKSKQLVTQIINNLASDRIGIIAYAGSAFPQLPITTDYAAAKMFLQALNTDMISSQGTAIGEAIDLATTFYNEKDKTNKILIILSDGEDHAGEIENLAEKAADEGINILTIGVGTPNGAVIPIKRNGIVQTYKKDNKGETVITKLDESTLKEIAKAGNGVYIYGGSTSEVIEEVTKILQNTEKQEFESKQFADFKDQFQWFLALALLLLFLEIFFLERKTSWLKKLDLFNESGNKREKNGQ